MLCYFATSVPVHISATFVHCFYSLFMKMKGTSPDLHIEKQQKIVTMERNVHPEYDFFHTCMHHIVYHMEWGDEKLKTLQIVSADQRLTEALIAASASLHQFHPVPVLTGGRAFAEELLLTSPDAVLLDMDLPDMDALEALELLDGLPLATRPRLFLMTGPYGKMGEAYLSHRIHYCFLKPLDPESVLHTMIRLLGDCPAVPPVVRPCYRLVDQLATGILFSLGVPPQLQGYHLLREAIKLVTWVENPASLSVMKDIYPAAADLCGCTVGMAEHAMRHAIESAWMRADLDTLQRFFGYTVGAHRDTPSNSAFIYMAADRVRMELTQLWPGLMYERREAACV